MKRLLRRLFRRKPRTVVVNNYFTGVPKDPAAFARAADLEVKADS